MTRLRRIAALTLATAAATGALLTGTATAVPADTAWGAPAPTVQPATPNTDTTPVTTFDTAWG